MNMNKWLNDFKENKLAYIIYGIIGGFLGIIFISFIDRLDSIYEACYYILDVHHLICNKLLNLLGSKYDYLCYDFLSFPYSFCDIFYYIILPFIIGFIIFVILTYFKITFKITKFIRKLLSKTISKAILFGIFFPTIVIWILDLLKRPIGYSEEFTALPILPGLYITNFLEKIGIVDTSAGHATPAVFLFYGFLFSIVFYFIAYLIINYIRAKKLYNKKTKLYFILSFILVLILIGYIITPIIKSEIKRAIELKDYYNRESRNQERIIKAINTKNISICDEVEIFVPKDGSHVQDINYCREIVLSNISTSEK